MNHIKSLDFYDNFIDKNGNDRLSGLQLIERFQRNRVHNWVPVSKPKVCKKVSFGRVSFQKSLDSAVSEPVSTLSPGKPVREKISMFFANITTWGPLVQNWIFSADVLNKYDVYGLVETHVTKAGDYDMCARARSHGLSVVSAPAMQYKDSPGSHGGETIFTAKHTFSVPLDDQLIEMASGCNDEPIRWTAIEIRVTSVSILLVSAYMWCGEGLSHRNWSILQQIASLVHLFKLPFLLCADFNFPPNTLWQSGWCQHLSSMIFAPNVKTTCSVSHDVIDYCVASRSIDSIIHGIDVVPVPWGPHVGLQLTLSASPNKVLVNRLVEPLALPMSDFHAKWKCLNMPIRSCLIRANAGLAHAMLSQHSVQTSGRAILGSPSDVLINDYKFQKDLKSHIMVGEVLAQASLQTELLICSVAGVPYKKYIGRSQFPCFQLQPMKKKSHLDDKFTAPAANFWGLFAYRTRAYMNIRTNDFVHQKPLHKLRNMSNSLNTYGAACTCEHLQAYLKDPASADHSWKGDAPHQILGSSTHQTIQEALHDLDNVTDLVLIEMLALAEEYKQQAQAFQ